MDLYCCNSLFACSWDIVDCGRGMACEGILKGGGGG